VFGELCGHAGIWPKFHVILISVLKLADHRYLPHV
jgi:hypothetical protein